MEISQKPAEIIKEKESKAWKTFLTVAAIFMTIIVILMLIGFFTMKKKSF